MSTKAWSLLAVLGPALLAGACTTSRMGGPPVRAAVAAPVPVPEPVEAVPSGAVQAQPLPPLDGAPLEPAPPPQAAPMDVAALPQPAAPAPVAPSGRSAVVGAWTARDAAGATCRVQLSSSPALDLYRASASGCANGDLAKVTAWDYRDGEVYLYQPGGAVAARLRSGGGALEGVIAKSGAPLTLAR
ncbi:MAG TPA: AprI/Inh family metalloprotease inhibitor [Microvirga sp.]|jgi:hypothetical protein|nr:AprI/Inh family metalloprotease inhibitor [Microvirga sp.]